MGSDLQRVEEQADALLLRRRRKQRTRQPHGACHRWAEHGARGKPSTVGLHHIVPVPLERVERRAVSELAAQLDQVQHGAHGVPRPQCEPTGTNHPPACGAVEPVSGREQQVGRRPRRPRRLRRCIRSGVVRPPRCARASRRVGCQTGEWRQRMQLLPV
eukprot:scaffold16041_cov37-Phaeocystis_antarctica.AAC.2